jgi:nitrogen regulatory protein P-II 1
VRVQLNIVLSDHNVERTVETICAAAESGEVGDGIIFVYPVEDVVRIRTREPGADALHDQGDIDDPREQERPQGNGHLRAAVEAAAKRKAA